MTKQMQDPLSPTQVVAQEVKRARRRRGWSAQTLANRCAEVGAVALNHTAITNIENGRRERIGVDELMVLAYVLALPPVQLLVPLGTADEVAILPTVTLPTTTALAWIEGYEPPMTSDRQAREVKEWREGSNPLARHRELSDALDTVQKARDAVETIEAGIEFRGIEDDASRRRLAARRDAYASALVDLATALVAMIGQDITPPPILREHLDAMRQLGIAVPESLRAAEDVYGGRP